MNMFPPIQTRIDNRNKDINHECDIKYKDSPSILRKRFASRFQTKHYSETVDNKQTSQGEGLSYFITFHKIHSFVTKCM